MTRAEHYNTKQRKAIYDYIASLNGAHVTAAQIAEHFEKENAPIGRTTIYRHLDKLSANGQVRRYIAAETSGACYQYAGDAAACDSHIHLKCEDCGELLHLECEKFDEIQQHVFNEHAFQVNAMKTVLYGKCEDCIHKNSH